MPQVRYAVPTPGAADRGTRRIVAGSGNGLSRATDHDVHVERIR